MEIFLISLLRDREKNQTQTRLSAKFLSFQIVCTFPPKLFNLGSGPSCSDSQLSTWKLASYIVYMEYLQTTASATLVQIIDHPHEFEMTYNFFANEQFSSGCEHVA